MRGVAPSAPPSNYPRPRHSKMFAPPLGIVGVLWILFVTGTNLSIQSRLGIIMMVGIVVAFSLLMVDFAHRHRAEDEGGGSIPCGP